MIQMEQPDDGAPHAAVAAALTRERQRAGLSLAEVARRAGIAKSTLSQLEAGLGNPSLETLWSLSVTLDVPFARLVEPVRRPVQVIRAGEGPTLAASGANYVATVLSACPPNARRDIYRIVVEPGAPRLSEPHSPGVIEHWVISTGRASIGPVGEEVELGPGDYLSHAGDVPHCFEALEPGTTAVVVTEHV